MSLTTFFKDVVKALRDEGVEYALAGGMIASIYRENERTKNAIFNN